MFTTFKPLLLGNLEQVYKGAKHAPGHQRAGVAGRIPEAMRVAPAELAGAQARTHLPRIEAEVRLKPRCEEYFALRRGVEAVHVEQMRWFEKAIRGILARKSILDKKQRLCATQRQIQVG